MPRQGRRSHSDAEKVCARIAPKHSPVLSEKVKPCTLLTAVAELFQTLSLRSVVRLAVLTAITGFVAFLRACAKVAARERLWTVLLARRQSRSNSIKA